MSEPDKKPYHHGDLRNALITAAIELLREKGANVISLREVAKKTGVSHAAPYRHFRDKTALLTAIAQAGFQLLATRLTEVTLHYVSDPQQQLIEAGNAYVELAVENPEISQLMFGSFIDARELEEDSADAFQVLVNIIDNGKRAGLYRHRDSEELAVAVWSMIHGLAVLITTGQIRQTASSPEQVRKLSVMVETLLLKGMLVK